MICEIFPGTYGMDQGCYCETLRAAHQQLLELCRQVMASCRDVQITNDEYEDHV